LLLTCEEAHGVGHPVWVTIPFDPQSSGAQPKTPARVVRWFTGKRGKIAGLECGHGTSSRLHTLRREGMAVFEGTRVRTEPEIKFRCRFVAAHYAYPGMKMR